jgi:hypothetical protein
VKVKKQLDATKYVVLLPQHVSGTNMPIIRSAISEYLPLLGGHTWKGYSNSEPYCYGAESCSVVAWRVESLSVM